MLKVKRVQCNYCKHLTPLFDRGIKLPNGVCGMSGKIEPLHSKYGVWCLEYRDKQFNTGPPIIKIRRKGKKYRRKKRERKSLKAAA